MTQNFKYFLKLTFLVTITQIFSYYFFTQKESYYLNKNISLNFNLPFKIYFILLFFCLLCYYFFKTKNVRTKNYLLLILAGGLSNLLDRYFYLGVVDYINIFGVLHNNLADFYIFFGLCGFLFNYP